jgi:hypothetical protein
MRASRAVAAGLGLWAALASGGAWAQGGPAEFPPASFEGTQYVDSRGCAFIRAGLSGTTTWVPRLTSDRAPVCGLAPSLPAPRLAEAPAPVVTSPPSAPEVPAPAVVSLAPAPAAGPGAPIPTVALTTAPPPAPARPAAAAAAPPPSHRLTVAEACAGHSGIQPGLLDTRTGRLLDCGPAPAPQARTVSHAQLCEDAARTGIRYINRNTGEPIACGPAGAPAMIAAAPPRPHAPAAPAPVRAPVAVATVTAPVVVGIPAHPAPGCSYEMVGGSAYVPVGPHCAPHGGVVVVSREAARAFTDAALATRGASSPAAAPLPSLEPVIPASNPVGIVPQVVAPPPGYEPVWDDGRINPWRGLPQPISGPVLMGGSAILAHPW